jgi:hypothetical protein
MNEEEKRRRQRIADKKYRLNHTEKCKEKDRKRYEENRESELARNKKYYKTYYLENRDRIKAGYRTRWHGITQEQLDAKMAEQNNCCAVCLKPFEKTPHIDHNHKCCSVRRTCGKCNRGLLCDDCNLGLGRFKDDIEVLTRAIQYLNKHRKEDNGNPI